MNHISIIAAKKALRSLHYKRCKEITEKLFGFATTEEIKAFLKKEEKKHFRKIALDKERKIVKNSRVEYI
jgi:phosphoenolpyruvate-protein kinase (PTS system EI component)